MSDYKFGFIDRCGQIAVALQYDGAGFYSEGLAAVNIAGRWGYIDRGGEIIAEPTFAGGAGCFAEARACVSLGSKWGYIDRAGDIVIEPQFDNAGPFVNGRARVRDNLQWYYIDSGARRAIDTTYEWAD